MPPASRPGLLRRVEAWSTARRAGVLTTFAAAVVAVAFLWPVALGGCTALAVVPGGSAGDGLVAGDVVVTRCRAPGVGDRVVLRDSGAAWSVARVVAVGDAGWHVRGSDGVGHDVPARPDVVDVLPLHVAGTTAVVVVAAGALAVAAVPSTLAVRRRVAARHA